MPFRSVVTAAGGAGSIAATAMDAALWMRAFAGGDVLSPDLQAAMIGDVAATKALGAKIAYGLGIQAVTLDGRRALGHSGRYLGFRNVVRYVPEAGVTIAVLTNQGAYDPAKIATYLLRIVAADRAPHRRAASPATGRAPAAGRPSGCRSAVDGPSRPGRLPSLERRLGAAPAATARAARAAGAPATATGRRPAGPTRRAQRLRLRVTARHEAVGDLPRDRHLEQALDAAEQVRLVDA